MTRVIIAQDVCRRCARPIDLIGVLAYASGQPAADADLGEKPDAWLWALPQGSAWCGGGRLQDGRHISSGPVDLSDPEIAERWLAS